MTVEPIYIVYLALLFLLLFFKESKLKAALIVVSFILIFVPTQAGSDYYTYKAYYETKFYWASGLIEPLYMYISNAFYSWGFSYDAFRFVWITSWTLLLCFSVYKMTKHFNFAFIILYAGYILYFLSAYRQFAAMSIAFFSFYLVFYKRWYIPGVILTFISGYIHRGGFLTFLWVGAYSALAFAIWIYAKVSKKDVSICTFEKWLMKFFNKHFILILLAFFFVRVVIYFASTIPTVYHFIASIIDYYYMGSKDLISFGMISRIILLFFIIWLYRYTEFNKQHNPIILFCMLCSLGYLAFPFTTWAGRFFNAGRMFECLVIPFIMVGMSSFEESEKKYVRTLDNVKYVSSSKALAVIAILVYLLMFYSQMTTQPGYSPFNNYIFEFFRDLFLGFV